MAAPLQYESSMRKTRFPPFFQSWPLCFPYTCFSFLSHSVTLLCAKKHISERTNDFQRERKTLSSDRRLVRFYALSVIRYYVQFGWRKTMIQNQWNDTKTSSKDVRHKSNLRPFKDFWPGNSLLRTEQLCCCLSLEDMMKSRITRQFLVSGGHSKDNPKQYHWCEHSRIYNN